MKQSVAQQDSLGCGIACVAFVANHSYSQVKAMFSNDKAASEGFYCKDLVFALQSFGLAYSYKYLKPKLRNKIYIDNAIVFIKRSKNYPAGHYLVRHRGQWMDPWINFQEESSINKVQSGFRKKLPGSPRYALFPE